MNLADSRVDGLHDDLEACEHRSAFWRSLAYACAGGVIGILTGGAPLVFGGFASQADVDALQAQQVRQQSSLAEIQGSLDVLIRQTAPPHSPK